MSLKVTCPSCNKTYSVADTSAGKKLKCKCGGIVTIPTIAEDGFEEEEPPEEHFDEPEYDEPEYDAPPRRSRSRGGDEDVVSRIVPYKNPQALISYYLAIFSLIPCFGILLGIPAVILGILGMMKRSKDPQKRGTAHALVGIILGGITSLLNIIGIVVLVIGSMHK